MKSSDLMRPTSPRAGKYRAEAPSVPRTIRFSPAELQRIAQAAQVNGQKPSDFARDAIVTAADDCLESNS